MHCSGYIPTNMPSFGSLCVCHKDTPEWEWCKVCLSGFRTPSPVAPKFVFGVCARFDATLEASCCVWAPLVALSTGQGWL